MTEITRSATSPTEEAGQKRISRKIVYWLLGVLMGVCVLLILVMAFKSGDQQESAEQKKKADEIASVMKQATGTADDIVKIKADQEQAAKEERERKESEERFRLAQQKPNGLVPEIKMSPDDLNRYEQAKAAADVETEQEMRNDMVVYQSKSYGQNGAVSSQQISYTAVGDGLLTPEQMAQQAQKNVVAGQARSAQFLAQAQTAAAASGIKPAPTQFIDAVGSTAIKPPLLPTPALSKYLISEGVPIPAITTRMINSDLPGMMEARVTRDVYDSITGEHLLIPMGSRFVGPYNSEVIPGQDRVEGGFTRLIFTNGASTALDGAGMADRLGQSGLDGDVNNHFFKQLALQFIVAGIAKVAKLDSGSGGSGVNVYAGSSTTSTAGQILRDTMSKYSDRYTNVKPTITVPEGTIFNVIVARDMYLPPVVTVKPNQFRGEK